MSNITVQGNASGSGIITLESPNTNSNRTVTLPDETGTLLVSGGALGTPSSGTLSSCTVDGTDAVGFRNTPVNSQSADYTLVLADSGKTILHPVADDNARTFTVTIAITTDTMYLANDGDTGNRTLAEYGMASAMKVDSTSWIISGNGLT
jgi:hypothetical protein